MYTAKRVKPKRRRRRWPAVLLLLLLLGALFFWSQQNWIQTETITVSSPRIPASFDGFRIAVVADLHGKEFGAANQTLLANVRRLSPDLIAVVGDLVHAKEHLETVPALASGLAAIAPTYYITGNHEWAAKVVPALKAQLEACGVTVLRNASVLLERGEDALILTGVDDPNGPADQKTPAQTAEAARSKYGDRYHILLGHRNDRCPEYAQAGYDLILSGHGHGGVIRLPFIGGLIGPNRTLFPQYTNGLYALGDSQLVVSRGLGVSAEPFRLFNRPHLPVVVLRAG